MKINQIFIMLLVFSILILYDTKVNAFQVDASMPLEASAKYNYVPKNLIDGSIQSAWCSNKTISPDLWISFKYPKIRRLGGIGFISGYAKNVTAFSNNSRPKDLLLKIDSKKSVRLLLSDSADVQWIEISPVLGAEFKFSIRSFYSGLKYSDVCIAEVFDDKRVYDAYLMLSEIEKKVAGRYLTPDEIQEYFNPFFDLTFNYKIKDEKVFWYTAKLKTSKLDEFSLRLLLYLAYYADRFMDTTNAELLEGLRDMVVPFIEHQSQVVLTVLNDKNQVMRGNIVSAYYLFVDQFGRDPKTNEFINEKIRNELRDIDKNIKQVKAELERVP